MSRLITLLLLCSLLVGATPARARHETGFLDRAITIEGVEYRYDVYVPRDWTADHLWPVILELHGGGTFGTDGLLATEGALARAIRMHPDRFPAIVVFPHAHPDGRAWQGANGEAALKEVDGALAEFHGDPSRVYLTGFLQAETGVGIWPTTTRAGSLRL